MRKEMDKQFTEPCPPGWATERRFFDKAVSWTALSAGSITRLCDLCASARDKILLLAAVFSSLSAFADPSWWLTRGVLESQYVPADYSPANIGQLKWMATNACDELEANLPGGAGVEVWASVRGFQDVSNWCSVNAGQLKETFEPFWVRLQDEGYTNAYHWTAATTDDVSYALVNLGQLKKVFSFDLTLDSDGDGLANWVETGTGIYVSPYNTGTRTDDSDSDDDGLSDGLETGTGVFTDAGHTGSNPNDADSDNDGVNDFIEVSRGTDPNSSDTNSPVVNISYPTNNSVQNLVP